MSSTDFLTRLEQQLVEAAERDVLASPARRRLAGLADRLRPRRALVALPFAAAALAVGVIAAVVLSLGGEQPAIEAGRGALPTDGLTVGPLGTAPPTGTALPIPPQPEGAAPGQKVSPVPSPYGPQPIPTGASVFVLNGTTRSSVADNVATRLQAQGADVEGTGNAPTATVTRSLVYSETSQRGRTVAQLLGIPAASGAVPRELSEAAGGAEVVILLGSDYLNRAGRRVPLSGKGGARGVVLLPKDGGLSFTATGLPPSNRYFLWGENPAGDDVPIGFATYDKRQRQAAGSISVLPSKLSLNPPQRIFLTREKTRTPRQPGRIVLDSGRIGG